MGGEKEGVPVSKNMVRQPGKEQKEGLKKGKIWMLHLREVQIWKSTHTHTRTPTHPPPAKIATKELC